MRRPLVSVSTVALAFIAIFAEPASAQRVLGVGDDALVLPRGVFRFRTLGQWTAFNERYGMDTPGRPNGALEPLGIDFTLDTIGVKQFPNLASLQAGLQLLTGNPTWYATLGNTVVNLRDHVAAFPFVFEAGLSKRFSVGIQIPYVHTQTSAFFNVNTGGTNGNLGFNPALAVPAAATQNAAMYSQFQTAANTLEAQLAACRANPAVSPSCPALLANQASAQSLITNSRAFSGGVNQIYSTSPFVPIVGTDAQLAIEARVAAFRALYQQFGVTSIAATTTGPFPSQSRLTVRDAQRILTDSALGIVAAPLQSVSRSHVGDIDIGGKFSVFDSFGGSTEARMSPKGLNFRTSVGGIFRIPSGQIESPDNFIDLGTGRGAKAVEGRWFSDLLVGNHFWESFILRFNKPFSDEQEMRILDRPNEELAPLYRKQTVHRQLGSAFEFETAPRIVVNDFLAVSGWYMYRHKQQDHYTGTFTIPAATTGFADITLDASTLDLETEQTEHRFGGGVSFSNLYSFEQGKARVPFEVTYLHWQTMKGSGGNQPKFFTDQIQLRLYARIFGGK
ncbi:MAG: hypothetical protein DMD30_01845 [Gemmatimonadetes bacterium]|nr:MAG: hypothetical protein DMD30_01845 [Gemmatimonadota bacterium]PYP50035.1 MAG: hypothetical protein DMD39_11070 [Gemmatimonadota bacterium]